MRIVFILLLYLIVQHLCQHIYKQVSQLEPEIHSSCLLHFQMTSQGVSKEREKFIKKQRNWISTKTRNYYALYTLYIYGILSIYTVYLKVNFLKSLLTVEELSAGLG